MNGKNIKYKTNREQKGIFWGIKRGLMFVSFLLASAAGDEMLKFFSSCQSDWEISEMLILGFTGMLLCGRKLWFLGGIPVSVENHKIR